MPPKNPSREASAPDLLVYHHETGLAIVDEKSGAVEVLAAIELQNNELPVPTMPSAKAVLGLSDSFDVCVDADTVVQARGELVTKLMTITQFYHRHESLDELFSALRRWNHMTVRPAVAKAMAQDRRDQYPDSVQFRMQR